MPELVRTKVGLHIVGEALDSLEVTRLLGVEPRRSTRKGDTRRSASGVDVTARSGSWRLDAGVAGDLGTRIGALLDGLPNDPAIWRELTQRYRCDVLCRRPPQRRPPPERGVDLDVGT